MTKFYVASVTPFDIDNKINEKVSEELMNMHINQGADGFFIGGSSAENFLMTEEERLKSFELAGKFKDKTDLIAHIGDISTDKAIFYAEYVKKLGYKKISAVPPFYFGFGQKEIADYFYNISNAVDMPVIYYNIPINTHKEIDLNNSDTLKLLKSGAISGIKHTNFDINQIERIKNVNNNLHCFGGLEQNMLPFLSFDCDGFIGSTFNFMLPHYKKIASLYSEHNKEALTLQTKANNIMSVIWNIGLFPAIKYILTKQGIDVGTARKPFIQLTDEEKKIIDKVIAENLCN